MKRLVMGLLLAIGLVAAGLPSQAAPQAEFATKELRLSADPIAVAMAPNGTVAYAIYPGRRLIAFNARTGAKSGILSIGDAASSLASSGSNVVITQGDPTEALVIFIDAGRSRGKTIGKIRSRVPIGPGVGVAAIEPDGSAAWIGHRGGIAVLALPSATIARRIDFPGQVRKIVLSGPRAWVLSDSSTISTLDTVTGTVLQRRDLSAQVSDIVADPNGTVLLANSTDGSVQSLDPTTLQTVAQATTAGADSALLLTASGDGVIVFGAKEPSYLTLNPLRYIGRVRGLGPASLTATSATRSRAWVAGQDKSAWIVDRGARPEIVYQVEPTKAGLQGAAAIEILRSGLNAALVGDVRILGSGTMEYEDSSGVAPMRLEVMRSGTTTYRDDGRTVTYMSPTQVCTRPVQQDNYTCRTRAGDEPDLVEQFRRGMPWERTGTAPMVFASWDALSRTSEPVDVTLQFTGGPVVGAASGSTRYRLTKGAFSIVEKFGNGPYYEITTRLSKPNRTLPQDLDSLNRS